MYLLCSNYANYVTSQCSRFLIYPTSSGNACISPQAMYTLAHRQLIAKGQASKLPLEMSLLNINIILSVQLVSILVQLTAGTVIHPLPDRA